MSQVRAQLNQISVGAKLVNSSQTWEDSSAPTPHPFFPTEQ